MGSKTAGLAIYLDAPLQSWGVLSKFQRRSTESYPSKSGVLGLVAAAMGIDKHDAGEADKLKPLASCKFSAFAIALPGKQQPVSQLEDYHTVGGGYDKDDPVQRLRISRKASGGTSTTVVTRRFYLEQARFIVVLEGDEELLQKASGSLEDPKWGVWFGRKCCLPSAPLLPTLSATGEKAASMLLGKLGAGVVGEGRAEEDGDGAWRMTDQPLSFGSREFASRPVSRK